MLRIAAAIILSSFVATAAWADIYKWTEDGRTVYSNVRPAASSVRNLQVVVRDEEPAGDASAAAMRREQELLDRIGRLERQVQAQQYPAPLPPPPARYDYGGYDASGYYPESNYPSYYPLPYVVVGSGFVPARRFVSRRFVPHRSVSLRGGGMTRVR
jgi:uncharacterized protein DUF4124